MGDNCANIPEEFPFPFKPYDIQLEFMRSLYSSLQNGKLGIFESPTGTGKSLSIICGAVKWLKDNEESKKIKLYSQIESLKSTKQSYENEENDWFAAQSKIIELTRELNALMIEEKKLQDYEWKIEKMQNKSKEYNFKKKLKITPIESHSESENKPQIENDDDEDVLLEENVIAKNEDTDDEEEESDNFYPTQIIISSRTHSQLSQFVGEIRKSPFADKVRAASLASRQNYCINDNVRKLGNMALINEKCLDMQKKDRNRSKIDEHGKTLKKRRNDSNCQCPYFKRANIETLRDFALDQIQDIEDLVRAGQEIKACPYYASRKAAEYAEILLVPYNTLLHKSTREANGINLADNVVIIDEAHNILEALAQMHGSELNYPQLYYSAHYLKCYKQRFNTMFSAVTLRSLNHLIFVVNKLIALIDMDYKEDSTEIYTLENFVLSAGIDQYNFFNLIKFCKSTKIAQKIRSYSIKYPMDSEKATETPTISKGIKGFLASIENGKKKPSEDVPKVEPPKFAVPNNPLLAVIAFLESLTSSYEDGRILLAKSPDKQNCKFQFLLLNPASNFDEIVNKARSVIVAGGTMKPIGEFRDRLFLAAGAPPDRITEFSCNHIIPAENILPLALTEGPNREKLLFNFANRMSMGSCLRDVLKRACETVKGGIVVFFPSYNYEKWTFDQVKNVDFGRILFREPQKSSGVDRVLEKYAATVRKSKNGAIMFSVVGGKLSEGLNFSDDLGRCVIVVGLPYANITSASLKEKMSYLDKKEGQGAGQQFYENLCMKAVNQCIGRAVRHRNDYATVILLDERYGKASVNKALPDWIKRSLKVCGNNEAFRLINEFFQLKEKPR